MYDGDFDALPQPTALKTLVMVHLQYGAERLRFACHRCQLVEVRKPDAGFPVPETCLLFEGAAVGATEPLAGPFRGKTLLVPIKYVTYIGLGPDVVRVESAEGEKDLVVIVPEGAGAAGAMSETATLCSQNGSGAGSDEANCA